MADLAHVIEQYVGERRKHSFRLKDGREYFGWLMMGYDESDDNVDYSADYVRFLWAPSPVDATFDDEERKVRLKDIDLDSLYYHDGTDSGWVKFTPDE